MRSDAEKKLLSAVCILVQEVVEDNGLTERFKNWAKRWGEMSSMLVSCTTICTACWKDTSWGSLLHNMFGKRKGKKAKIRLHQKEQGGQASNGATGSGDACTLDSQSGNGAEVDNDATTSGTTTTASGRPIRKRIRQKTTP